jgi:hypothetical protein
MHKERAEKQSIALQLRQLEQAQEDTTVKIQQLTSAGFFARRRLLRELRTQASGLTDRPREG